VKRPLSQTREDIDILADALRCHEQWRLNVVRARVAADFGEQGYVFLTVLANSSEDLLDAFRMLLKKAEIDCDTPKTKPADGNPW
jgi:hypothetical protein